MKLQFLGDSRDSFKWDLLHHSVTEAVPRFLRLVFVPMLTPDDEALPHGRTPAERFRCRPEIRRFVESLRTEPRELERVVQLGSLPDFQAFPVEVFQPRRELGFGWRCAEYWRQLASSVLANDPVFLDPDNGFETGGTAGTQHVRFGEVDLLLDRISPTAAICVFQYRAQGQSWDKVFERIEAGLPAETVLHSIYDGQLAFIFLSRLENSDRVRSLVAAYQAKRSFLRCR